MLSDARFETSLPCSDLQRAKSFYTEKLGLTPADEGPAGAFYVGRDGTRFHSVPQQWKRVWLAQPDGFYGRRRRRGGARPAAAGRAV